MDLEGQSKEKRKKDINDTPYIIDYSIQQQSATQNT